MARSLRVEFAGAVYHVMCRGNDGQSIFRTDRDRLVFLQTLEESCTQTGWRVHAYVLMGNHYHLLIETPEANLVEGMKWLQGTYTQRFNKRNGRHGHLFQGRYKSVVIDPENEGYFLTAGNYIHLNPVRAGLTDDPCAFAWSSCRYFGDCRLKKPVWLSMDRICGNLGVVGEQKEMYSAYRKYIRARAAEMNDPEKAAEMKSGWRCLRRGWVMGDRAFRDAVLDRMEGTGDNLRGSQRKMHGKHQAECYLEKALELLGLSEADLCAMKGTHPEKQAVAWLLKNYTVVTAVWIADRIAMGHRVNVSRNVGAFSRRTDTDAEQLRQKMLQCTG